MWSRVGKRRSWCAGRPGKRQWLGSRYSSIPRSRRPTIGTAACCPTCCDSWSVRRSQPPRSARLLEQVEEPVLVLLEHAQSIQLSLQLERLLALAGRLFEQALDPSLVLRAESLFVRRRGR